MANLSAVHARCLNCKKEVRPDDVNCRGCGDQVKPRHPHARIELEPAVPPATPAVAAGAPERPDRALSDLSSMSVGVQLTEEQQDAIREIRNWYQDFSRDQPIHYGPQPVFRLFGAAGTGKTTIAKHIGPALGIEPAFGAYTGKAAHVLRRNGVPATTIHSALYTPSHNRELRIRLDELRRELTELTEEYREATGYAEGGSPDVWGPLLEQKENLEDQISQLEAEMRKPSFEFNPGSEWGYADLIVLDEVSMVNAKMAADIERLGVPVLVLGDPCQLPPIDGGGFYTDARPDVLLEHVHRQALESPVLALATRVREGADWRGERVPVNLAAAMEADQALVWKNSTRWSLITRMRAKRGWDPGRPVAGDRIMCLVNNKDIGVFNGQQFTVIQAGMPTSGVWTIEAADEEGNRRELLAHPEGFQGLAQEQEARNTLRAFRGEVGLFTFADAITVHKAQGSEWDSVYVVDQTHQMTRSTSGEKRAWIYTACTRASEKVTIASTEIR